MKQILFIFLIACTLPLYSMNVPQTKEEQIYNLILMHSSLHYPCFANECKGDVQSIKTLLKQGADPNYRLPGTFSYLQLAAKNTFNQICTLLIQYGADINIPPRGWKFWQDAPPEPSALICALEGYCEQSVCTLMINKGASLNDVDHKGRTPLHLASRREERLATCELLIQKGASLNARCNNGRTPLGTAICEGTARNCNLLLKYGADLNRCCQEGQEYIPALFSCWEYSYFSRSEAITYTLIRHLLFQRKKQAKMFMLCLYRLGTQNSIIREICRQGPMLLKKHVLSAIARGNKYALLSQLSCNRFYDPADGWVTDKASADIAYDWCFRQNPYAKEMLSYLDPKNINTTIKTFIAKELED